ncbi:hypothetical protein pEaSNUABM28_00052 [Erwinia phage pEa_SNUABM_28]|uniref:Uncharacterized protein n=1 Tax=Erwinia phage pEa_SNUABM_16 TaxID=2869544 RepID=A0AAE8XPM9_9CAUD|nr:hypothetical protein MPK64_gp051 [Erwinia phage pEa_SNUABM_16]QZE58609.1 hypothetical protein pEaSNUABM28_00052 [Erwinia phage pEa_SNUABM_28]QZE58954.1 hypothetical protein pEaSNUABM18_00051 [Erwinia phage pEa_SNUABM_18]UAW96195.1 hypothetical protein pEaSNUABM16_00051 [Erwinia phage pEa_SNUABM_16]
MSKRQEAIAILKEFFFDFQRGFVRFDYKEGLSSFQFHVDEIREVQIHTGEGINKANGDIILVSRVNIDLIGGGSAHSCPLHPERGLENLKRLASALLLLRDSACGLPYANYAVKAVETKFYLNPPTVNWPVESPAE